MPHKHSVKPYVQNGFYHVYNRGVNKTEIFYDDQDYRVFLHLLKYYLAPVEILGKTHPISEIADIKLLRPRPLANLEKEVDLLAYCLMPNHFHLLIRQHTSDGMTKLMRRLTTTFALYVNKRHKRVGYLFQGSYKAVLIDHDPYLLHLSRYIHTNPIDLPNMTRSLLVNYPYSSYAYYMDKKHAFWVKSDYILDYFHSTKSSLSLKKLTSYQQFVEENDSDPLDYVETLAIDAS